MDYIYLIVMLFLTFFITIIGFVSQNIVFKFIGGTMFIISGLMMITSGIDVPAGNIVNSTIANITTETTTFTNINDIYTNGTGFSIIVVGLMLILSCLASLRDDMDTL